MNKRRFLPAKAAIAVILLTMTFGACTGTTTVPKIASPTMSNSTEVKTDLIELQTYVAVQSAPSSVQWQIIKIGPQDSDTRSVPGPGTYQLTAILSYAPDDLTNLKAQSPASNSGTDVVVAEDFFLSWFPASAKAAFAKQTDGSYKLKGDRYSAQAFYKSPYLQGSLLFISPTEVLIVLITD